MSGQKPEASPQEWAAAVTEHQECLRRWDARLAHDPDIAQTYHAADAHLPRREPTPTDTREHA